MQQPDDGAFARIDDVLAEAVRRDGVMGERTRVGRHRRIPVRCGRCAVRQAPDDVPSIGQATHAAVESF
ncbi:hypothetical protein [Burkholderia sp. IMCC1007]|uniref:hypothetical protein n=1 Tax=Burkholderia sp. IMCC1007 TaxID=3004104 RepID=UPI0022B419BA|nr:hypothetical protein [Burkholderia sp. IMCC1007]